MPEQVAAEATEVIVEWITTKEAAAIAPGGRMTDANVRRLIYEGRIEAYQPDGNGPWKINKASVLAYQPGPTSSRGRRGGQRRQI